MTSLYNIVCRHIVGLSCASFLVTGMIRLHFFKKSGRFLTPEGKMQHFSDFYDVCGVVELIILLALGSLQKCYRLEVLHYNVF